MDGPGAIRAARTPPRSIGYRPFGLLVLESSVIVHVHRSVKQRPCSLASRCGAPTQGRSHRTRLLSLIISQEQSRRTGREPREPASVVERACLAKLALARTPPQSCCCYSSDRRPPSRGAPSFLHLTVSSRARPCSLSSRGSLELVSRGCFQAASTTTPHERPRLALALQSVLFACDCDPNVRFHFLE